MPGARGARLRPSSRRGRAGVRGARLAPPRHRRRPPGRVHHRAGHRRGAARRARGGARPPHRARGRRAARAARTASSCRSRCACPRPGHLVVLDDAGFPPQGPPTVYDYAYRVRHGRLQATLTRTVSFAGLPLAFAEDIEVLPDGEYVVSESVFGGLWLIGRDGTSGRASCRRAPSRCPSSARASSRRAPFQRRRSAVLAAGRLRAGRRLAGRARRGALLRLELRGRRSDQLQLRTLLDTGAPAAERAATIKTVVPRVGDSTRCTGIAFARPLAVCRRPVPAAADPRRRAHGRAPGRVERRAPVQLPRGGHPLGRELYVASDQEYRWPVLNAAISQDEFEPPFVLARVSPSHCGCGRHSHPGRRARRSHRRGREAGRAPARAHAPRVQRVRVQRGR